MLLLCTLLCIGGSLASPCPVAWEFVGPEAYEDQSGLLIKNSTNSGATQSIVGTHGTWYAGSVNGGVWRTRDIHAAVPHWKPLFDGQPVTCTAMHALTIPSFDQDLVAAGCGGATSSEMGHDWNVLNDGDWGGVMLSHDGGDTWAMTSFPPNFFVTAIVVRYPKTLVVSARSNFFDRNDGGIWVSHDFGESWNRTFDKPVFDLLEDESSGALYAALPLDTETVHVSHDGGNSWRPMSNGLEWGHRLPFYPRLALSTAGSSRVLFIAALMVSQKNQSDTFSHVYNVDLSTSTPVWRLVPGQPCSLDQDSMPKDRVAILADPELPNIIYVAGNADGPGPCVGGACTLVFRIDWVKGEWSFMGGEKDTIDNSDPHPDCRDLAWEPQTKSLLLTHDGGITMRTNPRGPGGKWFGVDGDIATLELYNADWDSRLERFIGGAQDNDFLVTPPKSEGSLRALGYGGCDGTRTAVDNMNCPSRLFSACQFAMGLTVFSGWNPMSQIPIDLTKFFPDMQDLPYFVHPFTLNTQDPNKLLFFINGTFSRRSGVYEVTVPTPHSVHFTPTLVTEVEGGVYDFVAGGFTGGERDADVLVGMNNSHLVHRSRKGLFYHRLPVHFAQPVVLVSFFDNFTQPVLGPVSHGKTVSIAVSPADSEVVVVCGWPVQMNSGAESVHLSRNGGRSWSDITGNLFSATGTVARMRPSGPVIVEFTSLSFDAIVIGTVSGVFVSFSDRPGLWSRLGDTNDFPHVMTMAITYEHYSDVLTAATMGRGVFNLKGAKAALLEAKAQQEQGTCKVSGPFDPPSSAKYFPAQLSC